MVSKMLTLSRELDDLTGPSLLLRLPIIPASLSAVGSEECSLAGDPSSLSWVLI